MRRHKLAWMLGWTLCAATPVHAEASPPEARATVSYIANEGFLITGADEKILIDAAFAEGFGRLPTPSGDDLQKMRSAAPPFDDLTAILVSHRDPDHLDPAVVVQHLLHDPGCVVIGPAQVAERMSGVPGYDEVKDRVREVPRGPAPARHTVGGHTFLSVLLEHMGGDGSAPPESHNVGHVFTVGGIRFLHTGDTGMDDVEAFRRARLAEEKIDVAIVHWAFLSGAWLGPARTLFGELEPGAILLDHLRLQTPPELRDLSAVTEGLPPVLVMDTPGQTLAIERDATGLKIRKP